jgi:hypothetical protein
MHGATLTTGEIRMLELRFKGRKDTIKVRRRKRSITGEHSSGFNCGSRLELLIYYKIPFRHPSAPFPSPRTTDK